MLISTCTTPTNWCQKTENSSLIYTGRPFCLMHISDARPKPALNGKHISNISISTSSTFTFKNSDPTAFVLFSSTMPMQNKFSRVHCLLSKTRFQLILPVQSHNVTKNQTDHRMHIEGPQMCQINCWNNSFQDMYGMNRQKLTACPGK